MDIRLLTCVIIRKNGKYLVGRILGTDDLRWSDSPHDAWGRGTGKTRGTWRGLSVER